MRPVLNIILLLLISSSIASSFEYGSHLEIKGEGYLYSNSNTGLVRDHVSAVGEQEYDRFYSDQSERSIFVSHYNLSKATGNTSRTKPTYIFSSILPEGQKHSMKLSSISTMNTTNWVDRSEKGIRDLYRAATNGSLTEMLVNVNTLKHPETLMETGAEGDITFSTGMKTNASFLGGTDAEQLLRSMDSVKMYGEIARVEVFKPKTEVDVDGDKATFTGGAAVQIPVGDGNGVVHLQSSPRTEVGDESRLETIKESGVSEYSDVDGIRYIEQSKDAENLAVGLFIDPPNGPVGTEANFTLSLMKKGKSSIDLVSASARLPEGLDFIESPDGVYRERSRSISWSDMGVLGGEQTKDLSFRARVNENAEALAYKSRDGEMHLNVTYSTAGVSPNMTAPKKVPMVDQDTGYFILDKASGPKATESTPALEGASNESGSDMRLNDSNLINQSGGEPGPHADIVSLEGSLTTASNVPEMRLKIMQADPENAKPHIDVIKTASQTSVHVDDEITYHIDIHNTGSVSVDNVSVEDRLPRGLVFQRGNPTDPSVIGGKLVWTGAGSIEAGKWMNLSYVAKSNGTNINGDMLHNVVNISTKSGKNYANKSASSDISYYNASTMEVSGSDAYFEQSFEGVEEREPMARKTVHLGQSLIWDRHAYGGWKEIRIGDEYFVRNETDKEKTKTKTWYTPETGAFQ